MIYKTWEGEPQNETKALLVRENREGSGSQGCPPHEIINAEFMNEARRRGMMVVTWTVDEPEEFRRLIELKVDGIITNHPDRLLDHTRGYVKVERPAKL